MRCAEARCFACPTCRFSINSGSAQLAHYRVVILELPPSVTGELLCDLLPVRTLGVSAEVRHRAVHYGWVPAFQPQDPALECKSLRKVLSGQPGCGANREAKRLLATLTSRSNERLHENAEVLRIIRLKRVQLAPVGLRGV